MCNQNRTHHGHSHVNAAVDLSSSEVAECPVMPGSMTRKVDAEEAGLVRDYEGQRYWLCCSTCESLFDADPAAYANAS